MPTQFDKDLVSKAVRTMEMIVRINCELTHPKLALAMLQFVESALSYSDEQTKPEFLSACENLPYQLLLSAAHLYHRGHKRQAAAVIEITAGIFFKDVVADIAADFSAVAKKIKPNA